LVLCFTAQILGISGKILLLLLLPVPFCAACRAAGTAYIRQQVPQDAYGATGSAMAVSSSTSSHSKLKLTWTKSNSRAAPLR
jgi:hypothetical protein